MTAAVRRAAAVAALATKTDLTVAIAAFEERLGVKLTAELAAFEARLARRLVGAGIAIAGSQAAALFALLRLVEATGIRLGESPRSPTPNRGCGIVGG